MPSDRQIERAELSAPFHALTDFLESLRTRDYGLSFLFSAHEGNRDVAGFHTLSTIRHNYQGCVERIKSETQIQQMFLDLFRADLDIGQQLKRFEALQHKDTLSPDLATAIGKLLDISLALILRQIITGEKGAPHPHNLRHILSHFSETGPEFLLIVEPVLQILADQEHFALEERGRAARTLINNYDIERVFVYTYCNPRLEVDQKEIIIAWLTTFQKIYRRLQDLLYNRKQDKDRVAAEWFDNSLSNLKKAGVVPLKDYQVPNLVRKFISTAIRRQEAESRGIGRSLVLVVNNEDILRFMHRTIQEKPDLPSDTRTVSGLYQSIYSIMQEYREICTDQRASEWEIKERFSYISRERRNSEELYSMASTERDKTPILGNTRQHYPLDETMKNLMQGNLQHLFEIRPIPPISQQVFNAVCAMKDQLPGDRDIQLNHLLFQEKVLEFLMRLERVGIQVMKHPRITLITNAFQLNALGILQKRLYIGSTGCWQCPNQIPPSVICCTHPRSILNCVGQRMRHVFLRVFLGTGEFYESPFVLDSTLRYGSVDEEGLLDGLVIRPGLFLLDIPQKIVEQWGRTQQRQLSAGLENRITKRIVEENRPGPMAAWK